MEKIRKINPRADIASIVVQPTPRAILPATPTARTGDGGGGGGAARRPSSRAATPPYTHSTTTVNSLGTPQSFSAQSTSTRRLSTGDPSLRPLFSSPPGGEGGAAAALVVRTGGSTATSTAAAVVATATAATTVGTGGEGRAAEMEAEETRRSGRTGRATQPAGVGGGSSEEGPGRGSPTDATLQAGHGLTSGGDGDDGTGSPLPPPPATSPSVAEHPGVRVREDGDVGGGAGTKRRSLMGRMLGSGMLERQREWAKARNKKVGPVARGVLGRTGRHKARPMLDCAVRAWCVDGVT